MKRRIKKEIVFLGVIFLIIAIAIALMLPREIYIIDYDPNIKVAINSNPDANYVSFCIGSKFFPDLANCKDISANVRKTGLIDTSKAGTNIVVYSIDYEGINKTVNQSVEVIDTSKPIIDFMGNNEIYRCPNNKIIEPPYQATDNKKEDITYKVSKKIVENTYVYEVRDDMGNNTINQRVIIDGDFEKPVINIINGNVINIALNEPFIDPGVNITDNCLDNIKERLIVGGSVNPTKEGVYLLTYEVSDESGNYASKVRKVIVGNPPNLLNNKDIYLTFDDGPSINTKPILDVLNKYNVKATFFVTGQSPNYFSLMQDIIKSGHAIGLHTYTHIFRDIYASIDNYYTDINALNELIKEYTGSYVNILRFAGGTSNTVSRYNRGIMTLLSQSVVERGYSYFDWNIDSGDSKSKEPNIIAANVINQLHADEPFFIVLQHDTKSANAKATEMIIRYGLENGFEFKALTKDSPVIRHNPNN